MAPQQYTDFVEAGAGRPGLWEGVRNQLSLGSYVGSLAAIRARYEPELASPRSGPWEVCPGLLLKATGKARGGFVTSDKEAVNRQLQT